MGATLVITHRAFWHVRAGGTHQSCDCNLMSRCGIDKIGSYASVDVMVG